MPARNPDLHGSAPDKSEIALLLIDVINDLDFPEANQLLRYARPMARKLLRLKQRAKRVGIPVIYVNDNFGRWQSDFRRQVQHCLRENSRGHEIVSLLQPEEDDYFVLKPKHSGFFRPRSIRFYVTSEHTGSSSPGSREIFASSLPRTTPTCAITT